MIDHDEPFLIEETVDGLAVVGEVDADNVVTFDTVLTNATRTGDVKLDLARVSFMDSSVLRAIVESHQQAEEHGHTLTLVSVSSPVRRLLEISGLDQYLNLA